MVEVAAAECTPSVSTEGDPRLCQVGGTGKGGRMSLEVCGLRHARAPSKRQQVKIPRCAAALRWKPSRARWDLDCCTRWAVPRVSRQKGERVVTPGRRAARWSFLFPERRGIESTQVQHAEAQVQLDWASVCGRQGSQEQQTPGMFP
nr:hypothetical protein CFP56_37038 [Quercus suber]